MTSTTDPRAVDFRELALEKMSSVLGDARAQLLLSRICHENQVSLETADDLFRFAGELSKLGGFEGAVGALLSVRAVMLGAHAS